MTTYNSDPYGDRTADVYGDFVPPATQIRLPAELAGGTTAVEIGSGTGRIPLPLAAHVPVLAVDASEEMTRQLAKHTGDLPITPITANAAYYLAGRRVNLVFACFYTFFLLASEATRRALLRNAARMVTDRHAADRDVHPAARPAPAGRTAPRDLPATARHRLAQAAEPRHSGPVHRRKPQRRAGAPLQRDRPAPRAARERRPRTDALWQPALFPRASP
ncbi:class I SAM-dependent methyltransferase [Streptomyces sp. NPDC093516]|uniref:class I SAM-dependent methyltransferase n=1 Tax=Streptomyces sp. NPDC093516 TaxID=3155304 RepID=UPI00344A77C2